MGAQIMRDKATKVAHGRNQNETNMPKKVCFQLTLTALKHVGTGVSEQPVPFFFLTNVETIVTLY